MLPNDHRRLPRPWPKRLALAVPCLAAALAIVACSDDDEAAPPDSAPIGSDAPVVPVPVSTPAPITESIPESTTTTPTSSSTTTSTSTTTTTIDPLSVRHAYPVDPQVNSSWTPQAHANYQATDVFSSAGCGTHLLSPVDGTVDQVLPDVYDPAVDDPATRGGNAVSIIGDDGVRYYLAHFQAIDPTITPGARVTAGQLLGELGETGRAGACHVHFGLSLPCPGQPDEWWVRRGVIWPDEYLASWKEGGNLSPLAALRDWFAQYPDACVSVDDTPYPVS